MNGSDNEPTIDEGKYSLGRCSWVMVIMDFFTFGSGTFREPSIAPQCLLDNQSGQCCRTQKIADYNHEVRNMRFGGDINASMPKEPRSKRACY